MIALHLVDSRPRAACASIVDFVGPYSVLGDKRSDDLDAGSRFTVINPSRFSSLASSSASKLWSLEVSAAPRSQLLFEPIKRKVGSAETRTASLTSS